MAAEVAIPDAFVTPVFTPPAKLTLGPLEGATNDTVTPLTGLPAASLTVATRGLPNSVPTSALCRFPLVAVIEAGTGRVFDRGNVAVMETPVAEARTV